MTRAVGRKIMSGSAAEAPSARIRARRPPSTQLRPLLSLLALVSGGAGAGMAGCGSGGHTGADGATDAPVEVAADAAAEAAADTADDAPPFNYSCGAFDVGSEWTTAPGFRSAVVAMGTPLVEPVAITFGGSRFGDGIAIVVDQGADALFKIDTAKRSDNVTPFVAAASWPETPRLLTSIVWDQAGIFDRNLYVGDQGSNADADSSIYRVDPAGVTSLFTRAPGPGLDDVYGLALLPAGDYPQGLYVSGDTDGAGDGVGRFGADGQGTAFATFAGVEGFAVDTAGRFGGGLFAAMPASGGYSGDDTISRINPDGSKGAPLVQAMPGIHAIVFAPPGPFGGDAYAASWDGGVIVRIAPGGTASALATGLSLTNYDGNILAFSPDGRVLLVADRLRSRIVCIEPGP